MSYGFNTPQPEKVEAPKLAASGLAGYEHEIRIKDGQTVKFIALHAVDQSFTVNVHKKPWNFDGQGFHYVPVGSKNTHLPFLNPPVKSPFELDQNKEVRLWKTVRYMLVFVLDGNDKLKGHVAFLELRDNYKRKDGSYNIISEYEEQSGESVADHLITYSRTGSGQTDTNYKTTVIKAQKLTAEQKAVADNEVPELQEYLLSLYDREWTFDEFTRIYNQVVSSVPETPKVAPEVAPEDDNEIPF